MPDTLQKFLFENADIRGDLVHLDATWQIILEKHDYDPVVRKLLGEMMAAAALLAGTLKLNGRLTIQIQGNGPISLMVVECTGERTLRGLAHAVDDVSAGDLPSLVGDGRLAITLEPRDGAERYQSIVELVGGSLAEALENYLQVSEQLATHLWLAADQQFAAGMLIQKLPKSSGRGDSDTWNRIQQLSATIQNRELLQLPPREIIHRLYHEEDVRVFEPEVLSFRCACSHERVANMLLSLGRKEAESIIADEGSIRVACEFCNHKYEFDSIDVEQLFSQTITTGSSSTRH